MTTYENPELRRELGVELKRLRMAAGLTGRQVGDAIGVNQSNVSRMERGAQGVSIQQVVAWCEAVAAPASTRDRLLATAEELVFGPRSWSAASRNGSTDLQDLVAEFEAKSGLLSFYQPASIPGLLQTTEYARRLLSSGPNGAPADLGQRVVNRMDRQAILYDEVKQFRFVIPEAALRWPYGPADDPAVIDEHREQLARIEMVLDRPNIQVGVLPLRPLAVWRLGGFVIYDEVAGGEPFVHLELLTRPFDIAEPDDVEFFRRTFTNLADAAVYGDEARHLIVDAMRALAA